MTIESAKEIGERRVAEIATYVGANEPQRDSMTRFEQLVRHGYKFIDLHVRVDGREYHLEADWLASLFRESWPEIERRIAARPTCGEADMSLSAECGSE